MRSGGCAIVTSKDDVTPTADSRLSTQKPRGAREGDDTFQCTFSIFLAQFSSALILLPFRCFPVSPFWRNWVILENSSKQYCFAGSPTDKRSYFCILKIPLQFRVTRLFPPFLSGPRSACLPVETGDWCGALSQDPQALPPPQVRATEEQGPESRSGRPARPWPRAQKWRSHQDKNPVLGKSNTLMQHLQITQ